MSETTEGSVPVPKEGAPTSVEQRETGYIASTISSAKPDSQLIEKGDFGIVVYAMMTIIAFLLLFILAKEVISRSVQREINKSLEKVADAITASTIQMVRLESSRKASGDDHE